jgi:hypothetical protein
MCGNNSNKSIVIQEEIKRRFNSEDACYNSVQNLLPSLLSENVKIRIYKNCNFACGSIWL